MLTLNHLISGNSPENTIKGRDFTKEELCQAIQEKQAINCSLDLTNACNLNCFYCFTEHSTPSKAKKENETTREEKCFLIDAFKKIGAKTITIPWAGEPTLDKNFKDIISYIERQNLNAVLFTNGIRLASNPELIDFLRNNPVSIVLKKNCITPHLQNLFAGKKWYATQRDKALHALIQKGFNHETPTRLGINALTLPHIDDELLAMHTFCREHNIFPMVSNYIPAGRTQGGLFNGQQAIQHFTPTEQALITHYSIPPTKQQNQDLFNRMQHIDEQHNIKRNDICSYYGWAICTQLLGLYADIQGNIYPCVAQNTKLGNIREGASFQEIRDSSPYMESIRQTFTGWCPYKTIPYHK